MRRCGDSDWLRVVRPGWPAPVVRCSETGADSEHVERSPSLLALRADKTRGGGGTETKVIPTDLVAEGPPSHIGAAQHGRSRWRSNPCQIRSSRPPMSAGGGGWRPLWRAAALMPATGTPEQRCRWGPRRAETV